MCGERKCMKHVCFSSGNTSELICLYHLRGKCAFGKSCRNFHGYLPYQWQYRPVGEDLWEDVDQEENWQLDLTYCEPRNSKGYLPLRYKIFLWGIFMHAVWKWL